jgi:hypothetical protein
LKIIENGINIRMEIIKDEKIFHVNKFLKTEKM